MKKHSRYRKELTKLLGKTFLVQGKMSNRKFKWVEKPNCKPVCIQMICLKDIKCMIKKPGKKKLDIVTRLDHAWLTSTDSLIAYDKSLYEGQKLQFKAKVIEYEYELSGKRQLGLKQISNKCKKFKTPRNNK